MTDNYALLVARSERDGLRAHADQLAEQLAEALRDLADAKAEANEFRYKAAAYDEATRALDDPAGGPCPTCGGRGSIPPVKVCANENCGKPFRWPNDAKANAHTKGVIYCSRKCARATASRMARRRKRGASA